MRLAAELHPGPLGSYGTTTDPLAVISERGGRGRKGKGWE